MPISGTLLGQALLVLTVSAPLPALAQVYRCTTQNGVIYQALPCPDEGRQLRLDAPEPSAEERGAVRDRLEREQQLLKEIDAERAQARDAAERFRKLKEAERADKAERCAEYERDIDKLRRQGYSSSRSGKKGGSGKEERFRDRIRELEANHFSECFASG